MATQEELTSVLDAVRDAVPTLRRNGVEAEDRRMIPDENIALLEKAGVFRAAVPRAHGGLDLDVAQQARIIAEVSRGCPSTGWLTMVWLTSTWAASLYPDRAQQEVFEGGSTRVSIVFAPTGTLTPTDGGYRLDGTWRFNSGVRGAGWDLLAAMVEHPDGTSEGSSPWSRRASCPSPTTGTSRRAPHRLLDGDRHRRPRPRAPGGAAGGGDGERHRQPRQHRCHRP